MREAEADVRVSWRRYQEMAERLEREVGAQTPATTARDEKEREALHAANGRE